MAEIKRAKNGRIIFTKEMKKDYTILVPNMLPIHFGIMKPTFEKAGYKTVTPLVITDAENCKAIKATPSGKVSAGDVVIEIEF